MGVNIHAFFLYVLDPEVTIRGIANTLVSTARDRHCPESLSQYIFK